MEMYTYLDGGNILPGGAATSGMPTTPDAFLETSPNGYDFYMIVLERDAASLLWNLHGRKCL